MHNWCSRGCKERYGGCMEVTWRVDGWYLLWGIASGMSSSWKSLRSIPCPSPLLVLGLARTYGRIGVAMDALYNPS